MGRSPRRLSLLLCAPLLALAVSRPGPVQAQPTRQQAEALEAAGRFPQAAAAWQALLGSDSARPLDHDRALALVRLAISLRAAGEDGRADALLPRILAIDTKAVQQGDVTLPNAFRALGTIESLRQRPDLTNALWTHGFALAVAGLGEDHEVSRGFIWSAMAMHLDMQQEGGELLPEPIRREQIQQMRARWPPLLPEATVAGEASGDRPKASDQSLSSPSRSATNAPASGSAAMPSTSRR